MEMYKEASKQRIRFSTGRGMLATEQLWDLSLTELDKLAVDHEKEYKESGQKSFLVKKSAKDKVAKLKFDIILDILSTKVDEAEELREEHENKLHNQKILGLIADKKDDELKGKSVKELEKLLK